jgi:putative membrane protein
VLWIKALHIFLVVSWFAGLFYLPRIFVNLALVDQAGAERERLLLMAGKLYRFMTLLAAGALAAGLWLWLAVGIGQGQGWMHAKLALVLLLVAFHASCGRQLASFRAGSNRRSHRWYRWYNEAPTLLLLAIVVLVTVKPF